MHNNMNDIDGGEDTTRDESWLDVWECTIGFSLPPINRPPTDDEHEFIEFRRELEDGTVAIRILQLTANGTWAIFRFDEYPLPSHISRNSSEAEKYTTWYPCISCNEFGDGIDTLVELLEDSM